MAETEPIRLEPATAEMAPLLRNLLELYVHDLSGIFPVEIGPDGRFGYERLSLYFEESDARHAFLIRSGSRLAGFALATRGSPLCDDPTVLDVAEFFVLRGHRRGGVGRRAAAALWDVLPGRWIVRVSEANRAGLPFWRDVIAAYTSGGYVETSKPGQPNAWRVFSFESVPRKRAKR